jgi:hypothetical protein
LEEKEKGIKKRKKIQTGQSKATSLALVIS